MKTYSAIAMMGIMLTGCTSQWDMQGTDPKDYYAQHPIENKVESRHDAYTVRFAPAAIKLSAEELDHLNDGVRAFTPQATDAMQIQVSRYAGADISAARENYLDSLLREMGYDKRSITFVKSDELERNEVRIAFTYVAVVSPNCPDWRTSPITTYSNTTQGNFSCANVVNIGLMVADPHDLVKGKSDIESDTATTTKAVSDYRSGKDFSASSSGTSTSSSGATATSQ